MYNINMKTFYLDMDGVVADFDAAAHQLIGALPANGSHRWGNEDWQKIRSSERWFRDLPKTPFADELVELARQFRDQHGWRLLFLTAIPRGNDFPWTFYDKMLWTQTHYPDIPVHFGPYSTDKKIHCKTGDILVDDRLDNTTEWREAGGHAIRMIYKNPTPALDEVRSTLETLKNS
jgi:hypothetical protein